MAERDPSRLQQGIAELERVRLTVSVALEGGRLRAGDEGIVVHRYRDGEAFEVEFAQPMPALLTLRSGEIEPANAQT